jgi:radical SAM-linked protein
MAPEPAPTREPLASPPCLAPVPDRPPGPAKVRILFRKAGPVRFLSHHDLMRAWLRMLRRADLPVRTSQGFHPHPRLVFALSLPLGVVGCREVVDLELNHPVAPAEVHARLQAQAPPGLEILQVEAVSPRARAHVRGLSYAVMVPADRKAELADRIARVLAASSCPVRRARPGKPTRTLDLRPFLRDLRVQDPGQGEARLEMELRLTEAGTARPEEVLRLLGLEDLLQTSLLERTRLELDDQPGELTTAELIPDGTSRTLPRPQGPSEARPA